MGEDVTEWPYTLEKISGMWHWSLKRDSSDWSGWTGAAWTRRGAIRSMRRIKSSEVKRLASKERGTV
jgi:hypothetical protein